VLIGLLLGIYIEPKGMDQLDRTLDHEGMDLAEGMCSFGTATGYVTRETTGGAPTIYRLLDRRLMLLDMLPLQMVGVRPI
jgi:hypothetical protein